MTAEEARRRQDEWLASRPKWAEQDENGDDVSLIEESLRLTVTERFEQFKRDMRLVVEVANSGKRSGL